MNPSELRIGSKVLRVFDNTDALPAPFTVCEASIAAVVSGEMKVEPLNMSSRWLLKFGFYESGRDVYRNHLCKAFSISIQVDSFRVYLNGFFLKKIEYVHELQLLFFAFSDKELKIAK